MTDSQIKKIKNEITKLFGMPEKPVVNEFWFMMESGRTMLAEKAEKPECIAPLIDHTLLRPDATLPEIEKLCKEAVEYRFASVCVNPFWVSIAKEKLGDATTMVCAVIAFPLGANTTEIKVEEALRAMKDGATELDMVMNIGAAKNGVWETVYADIASVVEGVGNIPVKVILETVLLSDEEIARASAIAMSAGAAYIKTSTGFSKSGATVEAIKIMATVADGKIGVKASGGIGDFKTAMAMIKAGATRIGSSKSVAIVNS